MFVATNRLKPGMLDAEAARVPGLIEFVERHEPRIIAFNEYVNEDGTEVAVVQVHPDTERQQPERRPAPSPAPAELLAMSFGEGWSLKNHEDNKPW
jgi:hypothetical protein